MMHAGLRDEPLSFVTTHVIPPDVQSVVVTGLSAHKRMFKSKQRVLAADTL